MKRNLLRVVSLMLTLGIAFGVSGCKKEETAKNDGKIKLTLWTKPSSDSTQETKNIYEGKMELVRKKFPNIEIVDIVETSGTDYRQQYDKSLMAGEAPSFYTRFSYTDIQSRIKNQTIADITEFSNNWELKKQGKIDTQFDSAISKDNKIYAIPWETAIRGTLVNKKALKAGGGDPNNLPVTWDDFAKVGAKVTDFSVPRVGYELMGTEFCAWPFTGWVWASGGEMVRENKDGTYKVAFNEPQGVDAAMYINEMIWKHKMTQKDVLQDESTIWSDIRSGRAVFSWCTYEMLSTQTMKEYELSYDDFEMIPIPVKDNSIAPPTMSGSAMITFNPKLSAEELKAAWDVATYLYFDEEALTKTWELQNENKILDLMMPGRIDLYQKKLDMISFFPESCKKSLIALAKTSKPEPYCPYWTEIKNELVTPLQKIFITENITKAQTEKLLNDCADKIYEKYNSAFQK